MKNNTQDNVLVLLADRAPNFVSEVIISQRLKSFSREEIAEALSKLVESKRVRLEQDQQGELNRPRRYYQLVDFQTIPLRDGIQIGDVEVLRILSQSSLKFAPENINEAIERLGEYANSLSRDFSKRLEDERRRYLIDIVALFGVFASLIAFVVAGLPRMTIDPTLSLWRMIGINFAQVVPLAIVLAIFVALLRRIVR